MKYYCITGTSRGIGKALAEELLRDQNNFVVGVSRTCTINNSNYKHVVLDFTKLEQLDNFEFERFSDTESVTLINNSGTLGMIKPVGNLTDLSIKDSFNVNTVSPAILMNRFIKAYSNYSCPKLILNISSGAANNPYDGWSCYCASKAALDMYSKVIEKEQKNVKNPVKVVSLAPGIVDTAMQDEIRKSNTTDFSKFNDFVEYKNTGKLKDTNEVAKEIIYLIEGNVQEIPDVILSL